MVDLWLDDVRPCPYIGWVWAKNYDEAIEILKTNKVRKCSLDHDLSFLQYANLHEPFFEKTGYDVVLWMEENNIWPEEPPVVHSHNPVGAHRMALVISDHYNCYPSSITQRAGTSGKGKGWV
jgi:hypothetical protein